MPNRRHTASERSIPRMVAALTLLGLGAVWLLARAWPDRTTSSQEQRDAPRPDATPEVPNNPAAPLWASVAGEEDPGAAVEPPPAVTPHDGRE